MFFKGSRYEKQPILTTLDAAGRTVTYIKTRYIAPEPSFITHRVVDGERLDLIAHQYFRDPERFWRIGDANQALWPDDILIPGATIAIPPSEG